MFRIYHAFSNILVIFDKYFSPCKVLNYAEINILIITTEHIDGCPIFKYPFFRIQIWKV